MTQTSITPIIVLPITISLITLLMIPISYLYVVANGQQQLSASINKHSVPSDGRWHKIPSESTWTTVVKDENLIPVEISLNLGKRGYYLSFKSSCSDEVQTTRVNYEVLKKSIFFKKLCPEINFSELTLYDLIKKKKDSPHIIDHYLNEIKIRS